MSPKKATKPKTASVPSRSSRSAPRKAGTRSIEKKTEVPKGKGAKGTKVTVVTGEAQKIRGDDGSVLLRERISVHAYYLSEDRKRKGLRPDPVKDWLDAEKKVKADPKS